MTDEFEVEPPDPTLARQVAVALSIPKSVALVGVGGVGSWIGYFLALAGVPKLYLFDSDTVSESNLNRMPYGAEGLNEQKTDALAKLIGKVRPQCKIECLPEFTQSLAGALDLRCDWTVVSTDTWASRKAVWQTVVHYSKYIEAAAEGEIGSIASSPADWCTPEEDNPGYASVPVWVGPCVAAAMMAVGHVLHNAAPDDDLAIRMGWVQRLNRCDYTVNERHPKG